MSLEFYEGWAQDPNAQAAVSGAASGNLYLVAHRLLVTGGLWTAISPFSLGGFRFPMTVTVPEYLGDFKAYQILISADEGTNWRLAYTGTSRTRSFQSYDATWVISNPNRTIAPGLSLIDFGTFSSTISPSQVIHAVASGPTATLKVGARRASGQTVPELFGKFFVEYLGKYVGPVGSGLRDASGVSSVTYEHPYLGTNTLDLNLANGEVAALRLSLVAYDAANPISTIDPIQLNLDAGATTYPLPLATKQASRALLYEALPTYTSSGLTVTLGAFKLARFGSVISAPKQSIALPASGSTSVFVKPDGSVTLSPTGFSLGRFTTSSSAVTAFTPEIGWLPDETRMLAAAESLSLGHIVATNGALSSGSSYAGVALGNYTSGGRAEIAAAGVAWVKTAVSWTIGADVFAGSGGLGVTNSAIRIGYALSATVSGFVLVQLDKVGVSGGGGGSTNLAVANRTATALDVTSDTGSDATLPLATSSLAGLLSPVEKVAINNGGWLIVEETGTSATIASGTLVKSNCPTAQSLSVAGASGLIAVQGVGEGIWTIVDGTFITTTGANGTGLRRLGTHRYANVELINLGGSSWAVRHPSDMTGLELYTPPSNDMRVASYFAAITSAGGTFSGGDESAFAAALTSLDAVTSWADVVCWYPMIGGTLASMAIDAKNPNNSSQNITWGAANTASSAGVVISADAYVPALALVPTATSQVSIAVSVTGLNKTGFFGTFFASSGDDLSLATYYSGNNLAGRAFSVPGGDPFWATAIQVSLPFTGSVVASTQPGQILRVVAPGGNADTITARARTGLNTSQGIRLGGSNGGGASPSYTYKGFLAVKSASGLGLSQDQALQSLAATLQTSLGR